MDVIPLCQDVTVKGLLKVACAHNNSAFLAPWTKIQKVKITNSTSRIWKYGLVQKVKSKFLLVDILKIGLDQNVQFKFLLVEI